MKGGKKQKSKNRFLSDLENGLHILHNDFIFQWSLGLTDAGNCLRRQRRK